MKIPRQMAFFVAAALLISVIVGGFQRYPPAIPMEYPESKEAVKLLLNQHGPRRFLDGIAFDDMPFIPLYTAHLITWVFWIAFGTGEKERSAKAAAIGAILMIAAAAFWDYKENNAMRAMIQAAGEGIKDTRAATLPKWGYLGLALLLAGIANGFGMWTRRDFRASPRRIRTWACVLGGLCGIISASPAAHHLSASTHHCLFQAAGIGLAIAGVTVLIDTSPWRPANRLQQ